VVVTDRKRYVKDKRVVKKPGGKARGELSRFRLKYYSLGKDEELHDGEVGQNALTPEGKIEGGKKQCLKKGKGL